MNSAVNTPTPFDLLGIEPSFELSALELEKRHRQLSRALHPDRFTKAPATERRLALNKAIAVNEAFRALKDPIKRAEALCQALGLSTGETNEPPADPTLLMEMMESREALSEAHRERDLKKVQTIGRDMRCREHETLSLLAGKFSAAKQDPSKLADVLPPLAELRYLRRLLDEVDAFEEHLLE